MAGRMRQRHKGLPVARQAEPDMILDHGVATGEAMLIAQTLKYPLGRMPLLDRRGPVSLQDRIDHRQQRA